MSTIRTTKEIVVLSDSIGRGLRHLPGVEVLFSPGATITHWARIIESKTVRLSSNIKLLYIFIGTNDVGNGCQTTEIIERYKALLLTIKSEYTGRVAVCSILPRRVDGPLMSENIKELNIQIKKFKKSLENIVYCKTHGAFAKGKTINTFLYTLRYRCGRADLIHPNQEGFVRLRWVFRQSTMHYHKDICKDGGTKLPQRILKPKL